MKLRLVLEYDTESGAYDVEFGAVDRPHLDGVIKLEEMRAITVKILDKCVSNQALNAAALPRLD